MSLDVMGLWMSLRVSGLGMPFKVSGVCAGSIDTEAFGA